MQGMLTSAAAWTRFACALLGTTELTPHEIASEADRMLAEYLLRFPDPPGQERAVLDQDADEIVFSPPDLISETESSTVQAS